MNQQRLSRSALAGLTMGLLVLGVFGWLVTSTLGAPIGAPDGLPLSAQQPSPGPPATAEPNEAAPVPCRVAGVPFVLERHDKKPLAWGTLQNVGTQPSTPSMLHVGWIGAASLVSVTIEFAGASPVELFVGDSESPASVSLANVDPRGPAPVIEPGESARLNLHFELAEQGEAMELGPSALLFAEGCSLAMHQPQGAGCGLSFTNIGPSGNDKRRLVFSLANRGTKPAKISALDISWPASVNGSLKALYLDGELSHTFAQGRATSPVTLRLAKLLGEPVVLESNKPVAVWLEFEDPVAAEPYVITAATVDGCLSTGTTWLNTPSCGVVTNSFSTRGTRAVLRLTNSLPVTQTLHSLDLFWPSGANGPLVEIVWDGSPVWRGSAEQAPASIMFDDDVQIGRDKTAALELVFKPPPPAAESSASAIASGDYVAVFSLRGGCQLVFADRRDTAPGCSVSAGELVVRQGHPEVVVNLSNTGAEAFLRRMEISWPVRNGALSGVWLGASALFEGANEPSDEPFVLDLPTGGGAKLGRNTTAPARLRFSERASRLGYGMSLSFVDAADNPCAELLISPPPVELDCRLSITRVAKESERYVEVFVKNSGADEVELRFVNVEWPTNNGRNRLVSVHMIDRDSEFLLWSGDERTSPARVPFSAARAAVVDPEEEARLRLHYDQLIGVDDPATALKLTVGTAEGCQATHPDPSQQIRPERRSFSGIILDLPSGSVWGTWTIARQQGPQRDTVAVDVTDATRLEPSSVRAQVGDLVHIEAIDYDDRLHAEKVVFLSPEKMVQLIGTVVEIGKPQSSDGHPGWIRLSAVPQAIRVTADTRIDGSLAIGARVKVEGTSDAGARITAVRITVQTPPADEIVTIRGTVQTARRSGTESLIQHWTVGKYRVRIDLANPESRWSDPPYDRVPPQGSRFEIHGRLTGKDIEAVRVTQLPRPSTRRLSGVVSGLPDGGVLGTWTIDLDGGGLAEVLVETAAVVDARSAPVTEGVRVDILAQDLGGRSLSALSVRTDWPN